MKKTLLSSGLLFFAVVFFSNSALSAETAGVDSSDRQVTLNMETPMPDLKIPLLNDMMELLSKQSGVPLDDHALLTFSFTPGRDEDVDTHVQHPVSQISVGLEISF